MKDQPSLAAFGNILQNLKSGPDLVGKDTSPKIFTHSNAARLRLIFNPCLIFLKSSFSNNRRVHALDCIMGNQGNTAGNSKQNILYVTLLYRLSPS